MSPLWSQELGATPPAEHCTGCGSRLHGTSFCTRCGERNATTVAEGSDATFATPPGRGIADVQARHSGVAVPAAAAMPASSDRFLLGSLMLAAVLILVALGVGLYVGGVFASAGGPRAPAATHLVGEPGQAASAAPGPSSPPASTSPAASPPPAATQPASTTAAPGSTTPTPAPTATRGPAAAIQNHLEDLNSGQYLAAFGLMTPAYQAANPSWLADRRTADPGITVVSIATPTYQGDRAQVEVDFYARDRNPSPGSDTRCREFQGTVSMVRQSGHWYYDPSSSNLTATIVPSATADCPS